MFGFPFTVFSIKLYLCTPFHFEDQMSFHCVRWRQNNFVQVTQPGLIRLVSHTALHHRSLLPIQSPLEALSAGSVMPSLVNALQSEQPANPLHPISVGMQQNLHACLWHCSTSSGPLPLQGLLDLIYSGHSRLNMITNFESSDIKTTSGLIDSDLTWASCPHPQASASHSLWWQRLLTPWSSVWAALEKGWEEVFAAVYG